MQHVHLELHYRHHPTPAFTGLPPRRSLLPTPIGSTHHLCTKLIHVPTEHTLQYYIKNVKRCRDGNVCEAYVIPFLFGSFFTVCHPYIDVHFLKCFLWDFTTLYHRALVLVVKDGSHNSYASTESNSELNAYIALHEIWNCKRHRLACWQKKSLAIAAKMSDCW